MTSTIIQIIEDEPLHADLLERALRQARFTTARAADGEQGWTDAQRILPALILLDLMLPGLSGHEICRLIRRTPSTCHIPIIILTAVGTEEDRIAGLELGADDYVVKPFSPREVVSRVQAVLRRTRRPIPENPAESDDSLTVHEQIYVVSMQKRQLTLSKIELALLRFMQARKGQLVTAVVLTPLLDRDQRALQPVELDQRVRTLRRKLENNHAGSIDILPGFRYRFLAPSDPISPVLEQSVVE